MPPSPHVPSDAQRPSRALWTPGSGLRRRWRAWWMARLPPQDRMVLTQRNVYILPTPAGFMLALTLLVLLIASINYQLNLGYLLTFLLGGCAVVSTYVSHETLRGLTLVLHPVDAHHADTPTHLRVSLHNARRSPRYGIGLRVQHQTGPGERHQGEPQEHPWIWLDVPAQGSTQAELLLAGLPRGQHTVPMLTAETRFPLGIFRVWTYWRPAATVLVYPHPEAAPPPLPEGAPQAGGPALLKRTSSAEFDGVRPYRRGDSMRSVVWKKAAKSDELVSRDSLQAQHRQLWLDLTQTHGPTLEARLSRLCAWLLLAEDLGADYGLRLPGRDIAPAQGRAHLQSCLEALALY